MHKFSDRVVITTHAQFSQSQQFSGTLCATTSTATPTPAVIGPKRSRFLMRQSRIKRDTDSAGSGGDGMDLSTTHYHLTVPHLRVERQISDPLPAAASPPPGAHLLTVPGTNILVKQHSHPLLPSQIVSFYIIQVI